MNDLLRKLGEAALTRSLRSAGKEQGLLPLAEKLSDFSEDMKGHYTSFGVDTEYLRTKVLYQHAFQTSLALRALDGSTRSVTDIGDSSGLHTRYLRALRPESKAEFVSVNLDPAAVDRIRAGGLKALQARAEDIRDMGLTADLFLLFQTLEHLCDPFRFLHELSSRSGCRRLVLTVPYVRSSRLGLHHIRQNSRRPVSAERVHLLEFSPEDLRLLFRHAGWEIEYEQVYLQYPRWSLWLATRPVWARWDFEGFYGAILRPEPSWASLYSDW